MHTSNAITTITGFTPQMCEDVRVHDMECAIDMLRRARCTSQTNLRLARDPEVVVTTNRNRLRGSC